MDVIICDVKLPDANGVESLEKIKVSDPDVEVLLLTAFGKISDGASNEKRCFRLPCEG